MIQWEIIYYHQGIYKYKRVFADSVESACKKARLNKSIVDIQIVDDQEDIYIEEKKR